MKTPGKRARILFAAALSLLLAAGCGKSSEEAALPIEEGQSDLEYVQAKGTLVVGITDFAPMDYRDGEDWIGFDAELARAFAESIGVELEFTEIDWDKKTELLAQGAIDCIWNGMTMTEELQEEISCSKPYLSNAQVVVMRSGEMMQYEKIEDCQHLLFAVEAGSTGESLLKELNYRYTVYGTQKEALESVRSKKTDATVIDIIMAEFYTGDEQEFTDLAFQISLNDEKICAGFRKDSDLTEKLNAFLASAYQDGTISTLAKRYGIEHAILYEG